MIKDCRYKMHNNETKEVLIAVGDDIEWFVELGYTEIGDVEQGYDGKHYLAGYAPEKPAPTEEEIQAQLTQAVQDYMDNKAQEKNYDNIHTACTYANSTDEIFKKEGTACVAWRDNVWKTCYNILAEVKAGNRAIPTIEELIAELPVLVW